MNEKPVAYLISQEPLSSVRWVSKDKPIEVDDKQITNLYTKEQLQPKVQMTRKQYNQFENYKIGKNNFYHFWQSLLCDKISLVDDVPEHDLMLAWINSATIEIVPEKKWFVRDYTPDTDGDHRYLGSTTSYGVIAYRKEEAINFDTEEEAELWTNPLTEAVLLPVEGD